MKKLLSALTLVACAGFGMASGPDAKPSITVTGNGKVVYVPDMGYIQVGVSSEAWTAAEAWKKNQEIVKRIFAELKKLGIEEKDLKTGNLGVQPRYLYKDKEPPKFLGYTASYDLTITVHKLDLMGSVLDQAVEAGANRNVTISFGCSKIDQLLDEARLKAVTDARKKANLYVTGAGARLGDVLSISDTPSFFPGRQYAMDALAPREKGSLPVQPGEQEMSVTVSVTWGIDNVRLLEPAPAAA
jgi:uncharacterized protein YggE